MKTGNKMYAMIYFKDRKPIKKSYEASTKAFFDYEDQGCVFVELFNKNGVKVSSYPNPDRVATIVATKKIKANL